MTGQPVTVTYVEMRSRPTTTTTTSTEAGTEAGPGAGTGAEAEVVLRRARRPNPQLNRALYSMVGEAYRWTDRLSWTDAAWADVVNAEGYQTWLAYVDDSPIGYTELDARHRPDVEIGYFGLLPAFVGQGLGRAFLDEAVQTAWRIEGTERVWLHTCTDDHPRALPNYLAAGFVVYDRRIDGPPPTGS